MESGTQKLLVHSAAVERVLATVLFVLVVEREGEEEEEEDAPRLVLFHCKLVAGRYK